MRHHQAESDRCDSSFAQEALQQAEVGQVSETQSAKLLPAEPPDGVVLLWRHVRDISAPAVRLPDSEVQARIGDDAVQHGGPVNACQLDSQLFHYLPPERILWPLAGLDMPAWEVPHVWVPPPRRRPVTQQHPICLMQDHGHDAMVCHAASMTVSPDTGTGSQAPAAPIPDSCHNRRLFAGPDRGCQNGNLAVKFQGRVVLEWWWAWEDLNLRPLPYQGSALTV
jgi:hypothetical protein